MAAKWSECQEVCHWPVAGQCHPLPLASGHPGQWQTSATPWHSGVSEGLTTSHYWLPITRGLRCNLLLYSNLECYDWQSMTTNDVHRILATSFGRYLIGTQPQIHKPKCTNSRFFSHKLKKSCLYKLKNPDTHELTKTQIHKKHTHKTLVSQILYEQNLEFTNSVWP